jgi:hypothetical protein
MSTYKTIQRLTFLALIVTACDLEDPKVGINESDIIKWTDATAISIQANGLARNTLSVTLGDRVDANQEVTFVTDQGFFEGNSDKENPKVYKVKAAGKVVTAVLISDLEPNSTVGISASVGGFKVQSTVNFIPSRPDVGTLQVDKQLVDADRTDFSTFNIILLRDEGSGKVSDDIRVFLYKKETGKLTVDVPSFVVTKDGKASFTVKSTNDSVGTVTIRVRVAGMKVDSIRLEKTIKFQ